MLDIKMHQFYFVLAALPNDVASQAASESGFKIDPSSLASEIRYDELGSRNLGQDSVGDSLVGSNLFHTNRLEAALANCRFDSVLIRSVE